MDEIRRQGTDKARGCPAAAISTALELQVIDSSANFQQIWIDGNKLMNMGIGRTDGPTSFAKWDQWIGVGMSMLGTDAEGEVCTGASCEACVHVRWHSDVSVDAGACACARVYAYMGVRVQYR